MNRVSKFLSIAAATAAMTGVAFADDPTPDPKPDDAGAAAVPATGDAKPAAAAEVGGAYTAATWPKAYVDRPQSAAKGMIEITPQFVFARSTTTDTAGNSSSSNATSINLGGRYGVTDKIEVLAAFNRIILSPSPGSGGDRVKGSLIGGLGIGLAKGKFDAEVKAAINYDLLFKTAVLFAGVDVRYHLGPKMWIGTPVNEPGLVLTVKGIDVPVVGSIKPMFFTLPLAFAFQATPELALQVDTEILTIGLNDAGKPGGKSVAFFSQDEFGGIPLRLDGIYAISNKMDGIVTLDLGDLKNAGDALGITAGVNIRM